MDSNNQDIRWKQRFVNYKRALAQLSSQVKAVEDPEKATDTQVLATIQAFEFTFELSWQVLKDFLEDQGNRDLYGSKNTLRKAFEQGLVTDGQIWMDMIEARNESVHTYDEETADALFRDIIGTFYAKFTELETKFEAME
jgi:nucleotidyltransferase substrate binding protein (TIGR01987 family)